MRPLLLGLLAAACLVAAAEEPVKVDNDIVLIRKVVDAPKPSGPMHQHERNRVMIYLDKGDITLTYEDGHSEKQHWKAGQVAWSPTGPRHSSRNPGKSAVRIVEVELKKPAPAPGPSRKSNLDPLTVDPSRNKLEFENQQVRVYRATCAPGASEPMHEHPGVGMAEILLTDLDITEKHPDGTVAKRQGTLGDVIWTTPRAHALTNNGKKKFEMIVVEVK